MSFPNTVYGSYGDQYTSQTTKIDGLPLGTKMELPDGKIFRHCKAGGTTLSVSKLVQTEDTVDDHDTVRTTSDRAEHPPGFISFCCVAMDQNAGASQGDRNRLALISLHGLSIEGELDLGAFLKLFQDRVFIDSHRMYFLHESYS